MQGEPYSAGILCMLCDFTFLDLFSERCSVAGAVATCAADLFRAFCHDVLLCRPSKKYVKREIKISDEVPNQRTADFLYPSPFGAIERLEYLLY
jgi:hypothetical protein